MQHGPKIISKNTYEIEKKYYLDHSSAFMSSNFIAAVMRNVDIEVIENRLHSFRKYFSALSQPSAETQITIDPKGTRS